MKSKIFNFLCDSYISLFRSTFKMISLVKTVIAIFAICNAAALSFKDGSSWKRLFDDQETEEPLEIAENDKK